jgi:hypothetical protein
MEWVNKFEVHPLQQARKLARDFFKSFLFQWVIETYVFGSTPELMDKEGCFPALSGAGDQDSGEKL